MSSAYCITYYTAELPSPLANSRVWSGCRHAHYQSWRCSFGWDGQSHSKVSRLVGKIEAKTKESVNIHKNKPWYFCRFPLTLPLQSLSALVFPWTPGTAGESSVQYWPSSWQDTVSPTWCAHFECDFLILQPLRKTKAKLNICTGNRTDFAECFSL